MNVFDRGQDTFVEPSTIAADIRGVFRILKANAIVAVLTAVTVMVLVVLYIWTATPLYRSHVDILIDPREKRTLDSGIAPTGLGSSAAGPDTLLLDSQIRLIESKNVVDKLILSENLVEDSEFVGSQSSFWPVDLAKTLVKMVVYGPQEELWRPMNAYDEVVKKLDKRMQVSRLVNTYVVRIAFFSKNPDKAARLARRMSEIYIEEINSSAASATQETATILSSKLETLKQAAERSAAAVEQYKTEHNLIDANQILVVEQQLSDLNSNLSQARSQMQTALAERNQVQRALRTGDGPALRILEPVESTVMSQLQTSLAEIEAAEADMTSIYLSSHPSLRRLRERKAAIVSSMNREYDRILGRLNVAYESAREKVASLESEVTLLEARMSGANSDTVQLQELEREAESSRTIYEKFLLRSKAAWEEVDVPTSTARIISPPYAASKPAFPQVLPLLAGGGVVGAILGAIAAMCSYIFGWRQAADPRSPIRSRPPKPNTVWQESSSYERPVAAARSVARAQSVRPSLLDEIRNSTVEANNTRV